MNSIWGVVHAGAMRAWGAPLLFFVLLSSSAQAGLFADGPVDVLVLDDREGCESPVADACFVAIAADGAPGEAEVDAYQRVYYVGAYGEDAVPLLPDESVSFRGSEVWVRQPALRLATESYNGAAPDLSASPVAPDLTSQHAAVRVGEKLYGGEYVDGDGGVGYERAGPFHRPTGTDTDYSLTGFDEVACGVAAAEPTCAPTQTYGAAYRSATPNVKWGLEVYDMEVATRDPQLRDLHRVQHGAVSLVLHRAGAVPLAPPASTRDRAAAPEDAGPAATPAVAPVVPQRDAATGAPPLTVSATTTAPPQDDAPLLAARVAAVALGALVLAGAALYSRFQTRQSLLESSARERVLAIVDARPGVCLSEVADEMGVTRNAVAHHVRMLHRARLVEVVEDDGRRRLYKPGTSVQPDLRVPAAVADHPVRGRIVALLGAAPAGVTRRDIHASLADVPERTRNHAVRRLALRGIVEVVKDAAGEERIRLASA